MEGDDHDFGDGRLRHDLVGHQGKAWTVKNAIALACFAAVVLIVIAIQMIGHYWQRLLILLAALALLALSVHYAPASAHDLGQWEGSDPKVREWYQKLMQPDNPAVSCCGEADAYWADSFEVSKDVTNWDGTVTKGGLYVAIITDTRPDEPLRRKHIDIGTKIVIPNHKIKYDQSNPTGHGIVFLSRGDYVYCYVPPGGV
jgi:hypothetical protein